MEIRKKKAMWCNRPSSKKRRIAGLITAGCLDMPAGYLFNFYILLFKNKDDIIYDSEAKLDNSDKRTLASI